jgi:hypothetical protein
MVAMLSIHGAVETDTKATREVLADLNDALAAHFKQRMEDAAKHGGARLSKDEIQGILTMLRQNGISAPAAASDSITDRARTAGKLQFGALEEKRNVVPFRRPRLESPACPDQQEQSADGA